MGCGYSVEEGEAEARSKSIDKSQRHDHEESSKRFKLLLLGASQSGKSTIMKQMKIIHNNVFTDEDHARFKSVISSNSIMSLILIIKGMDEMKIDFGDERRLKDAELLYQVAKKGDEASPFSPELVEAMKRLWQDTGVQDYFRRWQQLKDLTKYYLDAIDRLGEPGYRPTEQDILRTRIRTSVMAEMNFTFRNFSFKLIDVGGQRTERRKWFHTFENVQAVIFCADLCSYDLKLAEDNNKNRMEESIKLFESIVNNEHLLNSRLILLLNKMDIFAEKIKVSPLTICFPHFNHNNTLDGGVEFIKQKYLERNCNETKEMRHETLDIMYMRHAPLILGIWTLSLNML